MAAGLVLAPTTGGLGILAVILVIALAVGRSGSGLSTRGHAPNSELARAREEIQRQIDAGRGM